ncbi:MAG: TIGR03013 family XrtA/PEP-CTERM system glycosyltransferase [Rhodospirillaceae bacterium]
MVRVFGHHISLRAVLFAVVEIAAFITFFNISRAMALYLVAGDYQGEIFGQTFLLPLFCVIAFATASACGLYNREISADPNRIVLRLATVAVLMYFLMAVSISLAEMFLVEDIDLKLYYAIALGAATGFFLTALLFRHRAFAYNFNGTALERRILVVGVDECAAKIEYLNGSSRSPYRAVGFVPIGTEEKHKRLSSYKVLPGRLLEQPKALAEQARVLKADEVVVPSRERNGLPVEALMECKLAGLSITEFSSFWERQTGQIDLDAVSPGWLIFSEGFRTSWARTAVKRAFDIVVACLVLILTLPITVLAAVAIRIDSPGPIFYRQERVGANGRSFWILKFRSMRTDAEKDGVARWAQSNDSRVTRVGKFIRRTRIDEIPQIINVLVGDMSFVGPRPERPVFVEGLKQKIPYYDVRHRVKPGITGWAQINYPYGASDEDAKAKLAYDLYYVKNGNIFLDAVVLFQTARVVLWQEGAR